MSKKYTVYNNVSKKPKVEIKSSLNITGHSKLMNCYNLNKTKDFLIFNDEYHIVK